MVCITTMSTRSSSRPMSAKTADWQERLARERAELGRSPARGGSRPSGRSQSACAMT
jgi:hypothetical protein